MIEKASILSIIIGWLGDHFRTLLTDQSHFMGSCSSVYIQGKQLPGPSRASLTGRQRRSRGASDLDEYTSPPNPATPGSRRFSNGHCAYTMASLKGTSSFVNSFVLFQGNPDLASIGVLRIIPGITD
ncbi:hypothetical protein GE21DRAFT_3083 [Neurospora crassa]|uniref:Uncharacterized protein n=2 Tax=Neurospora crassa TaxID=5141 RepID=Q1K8X5_NEUCR|nr:hypothetical protein NCU06810 [Neurospora crassa OR74A]EAA34415.1 hypothetical protein NCU06810 [Neurospora crassa OR74A]KHE87620.1 hypothetical protein GE21DRAFT_3083 [Neurospora crassa]CAB91721.2 hypothetical protein [Neurospora crassa]|eukprot:XP_963651.1 hypothetical protein NCU06810 [Neurospora crassa OR74A]